MLRTRVTTLLGIDHPVVLGGMGSGTNPALVTAVSNAGGLGVMGMAGRTPDGIAALAADIRAETSRPFGLNLLLFLADDAAIDAVLAAKPHVFSTAWPRQTDDLTAVFRRAHAAGCRVMHMASTLAEARRAADAGADIIVPQGTEGGGHVGLMSSIVLVRQVVRALPQVPVLAAGGIADGAGLAAMLMLGADGVLVGTRLLATPEAPLPDAFKQAIVRSTGDDTLLSEMPDVVSGNVWPGAFARVLRNRFVQEWLGREGEVRLRQPELNARVRRAREQGDADDGVLLIGQDAGLIDSIVPAAEVVERMVREAEAVLSERTAEVLPGMSAAR
jgi:NAD(P)H-dependent flavin oxidoreductase YrpB (nitropropane dioxygenase family)